MSTAEELFSLRGSSESVRESMAAAIKCCQSFGETSDPHERAQMVVGRKSLAPTTSASVELFVFNFCLVDLQAKAPVPIEMAAPVWLRMSW